MKTDSNHRVFGISVASVYPMYIEKAEKKGRTKAEVVNTLAEGGVPAAPVNNVAEMVADPQIQARKMFVELEHPIYGPVKITGTPLKLSETPGRVERLAPMPGEHNEEIFVGMLGYTKEDLARWQKEGVV